MPVTAKLSKAFYERFGDEIANELVDWFNDVDAAYRGELRELNEVNYARFETKLDQKVTEMKAAFQDALTELRTKDLTDIRLELRDREARLVRWMLAFWLTTIGTMIALLRLWG